MIHERIIAWVALLGAALAHPPLLLLYLVPVLVALFSKKGTI